MKYQDYVYYLLKTGRVKGMSAIVLRRDPNYFDHPLVKRAWRVDNINRLGMIKMLRELKQLKANPEDIRHLETLHQITIKDYRCAARIEAGEDPKKVVEEIFGPKSKIINPLIEGG